ncbi:MAG: hypothetical protein WBC61_09860 [Dehalococcoidia bacterium]
MAIFETELNRGLIEGLTSKTLHKLGYDASETLDPKIAEVLDGALLVARKLAKPRGIYRTLPVLGTSRYGVKTEAGIIRSAMFTRLANMCRGDRSIVFMITTIGEELEITGRASESLFHQLVFDTLGSELTEMVADMLEADWRAQLSSLGLQCSSRFSPGYCDWALDGQDVIFKALDAGLIDVHLTPQFVIVPSKSISAIAVAAEEVPISSPCVFCAKEDCSWRRLPEDKTLMDRIKAA